MISWKTLEFGYNWWIWINHNKHLHDSGSVSPSSAWFHPVTWETCTLPLDLTILADSALPHRCWLLECKHWSALEGGCARHCSQETFFKCWWANFNPATVCLQSYMLVPGKRQTDRLLTTNDSSYHLGCVKRDKKQRQPCTCHVHQVSKFSFLLSYGMKRAPDRDVYWPASDSQ